MLGFRSRLAENSNRWTNMRYSYYYYLFQIALRVEAWAVKTRDRAQREKMKCIPAVPGYWAAW